MTAAATGETIVVYTVSTNRTLVLTDLIFSHPDSGAGLEIYDSVTATASPTAATSKMRIYQNPVILTDMRNGPEFLNGISTRLNDASGNLNLLTYSCFIGGHER